MNRWLQLAGVAVCALAFSGIAFAEADKKVCRDAVATSCIQCHGLKKTCTALAKPDTDWKQVMTTMGPKAKLDQAGSDKIHDCLQDAAVREDLCPDNK